MTSKKDDAAAKRERRFSLTVRGSSLAERNASVAKESNKEAPATKLKTLFERRVKREESAGGMARTLSRSTMPDWPAPGKVEVTSNSPNSAPGLVSVSVDPSPAPSESSSPRSDPRSSVEDQTESAAAGGGGGGAGTAAGGWVPPSPDAFCAFCPALEPALEARIAEADPPALAELFRPPPPLLRLVEFVNRRPVEAPPAPDSRPFVLYETVQGATAFYARPWTSLTVGSGGGGGLQLPAVLPPLLRVPGPLPRLDPPRDVLRVPRIPFQAEGAARHFMLSGLDVRVPGMAAEPLLATLAVFDREMQTKMSADVCWAFPGSLLAAQVPPHLTSPCAASRVRRAVVSLPAASREVFFVVRLFRLHRPGGRRATSVAALRDKERLAYDRDTLNRTASPDLSQLWEPFAVAFCPTLRQHTGQGFVTSRGTSVKALEPLAGRVELREVFECYSSGSQSLFALLNAADGPGGGAAPPATIEGAFVQMDVEVEWSAASHNAFLDGFVDVVEPLSPGLTVAASTVNVLFVYPMRVVASPAQFPHDALLIIRVLFRPSAGVEPIPLQYQCACLGGEASERPSGWTALSRAENCVAEFQDEIRVQLPLYLEASAQLVLQVVCVDAEVPAERWHVVETVNVTLFVDPNKLLENGAHSALLAPSAAPATLFKGEAPMGLPAIKFATRFVSTVYFQDSSTSMAVKYMASLERSRALQTVVLSVSTIPRPVERFNFPILLSGLLGVMLHCDLSTPFVSISALTEAVCMLDRLHMAFPDSSSAHHPFLLSFACHMFTPPGPRFAETLCSTWLQLFEQMPTPGFLEKMTLSRSWPLLDCLFKSLASAAPLAEVEAAQHAAVAVRSGRVTPRFAPPQQGAAAVAVAAAAGTSPAQSSSRLTASFEAPTTQLRLPSPKSRRLSVSAPQSPLLSSASQAAAVSSASPQMVRKVLERATAAAAAAAGGGAAPAATSSSSSGGGLTPRGSSASAAPPPTPWAGKSMQALRAQSPELMRNLKLLTGRLIKVTREYESAESAELSMLELAKGLRVAFACMDRGFALDLLQYTLACMDSVNCSAWTTPLLTVVLGCDEFFSLSLPATPPPLTTVAEFVEVMAARHPLVGILVSRLRREVQSTRTVWLLLALLAHHDVHPVLAQPNDDEDVEDDGSDDDGAAAAAAAAHVTAKLRARAAVVGMYFPFLPLTVELHRAGQLVLDDSDPNGASNGTGQAWFSCAVFVAVNVSPELRLQWYAAEGPSGVNGWLDFLVAGCRRPKPPTPPTVAGSAAASPPVRFALCLAVLELLLEMAQHVSSGPSSREHAPLVFSLLNALFEQATAAEHSEADGSGSASAEEQQFVARLFRTAEVVAKHNLAALFEDQRAPYCQMLVIPTLALCNAGSDRMRNAAARFLWRLIQLNDEQRGSFVQVRLACTIAMSRLATQKKGGDAYLMKRALDGVVALSAGARLELREGVAEMTSRLFGVLKSTVQLATFEKEPEQKVDVCYRISEGYVGSPDLRMTWLKIVASQHVANKDFLEAAQAHLVLGYLIAQYLELMNLLPPGVTATAAIARLCPAVLCPAFVGVTREDADNRSTALRLDFWSVDGLGQVLFEAAQLLADAGLYEWSLDCYNVLIGIRRPLGQWLELLKAYAGAQLACKQQIKLAKAPAAEPKFFRVKFIGLAFDRLNGKAFVYRGDAAQRLMDFSTHMVKRCQDNASSYGASRVELLGNDREATPEQLEQREVLYLQVARVYPTSALPGGVVQEFLLDMAHSSDSSTKQQQLVASQGRKKIYFTTERPFPSFSRRVEIVAMRSVILTPLQNALQLMIDRVQAVRSAVESNNATVISGLLYGNLMTTISEGPEAVAEGFLSERSKTDDETERLRGLVRDFLQLTAKALDVHETLMSSDMGEWQQTARNRYNALKTKLSAYLNNN